MNRNHDRLHRDEQDLRSVGAGTEGNPSGPVLQA